MDISREISLKGVQDIAGAYQRFDIFQLNVNQAPLEPVRFYNNVSIPARDVEKEKGEKQDGGKDTEEAV